MNRFEQEYNNEFNILKALKEKQQKEIIKLRDRAKTESDKNIENRIQRLLNGLSGIESKLSIIRVGNEETEQEKQDLIKTFVKRFNEVIDPEIKLNFHGCRNLSFVKSIIESKQITNSEKRTGQSTSFDTGDAISVTTPRTFNVTAYEYMGLGTPSCYPAGALFVLAPCEDYRDDSLITRDCYFDKEPDRLLAIVSTKENQDNIKTWLSENDMNPDLCITFDDFLLNVNHLADKKNKNNKKM